MIIDDIRDKFIEVFGQVRSGIEESDAYNQLRERYDSLPPAGQIATLSGAALLMLFLALQVPFVFYSTSSDYLAMVDENRDLVLDFYRAKREKDLLPPSSNSMGLSEIEARARRIVKESRIQESQLTSIMPLAGNLNGKALSVIPKGLSSEGIEIQLSNLNLTQVVDYGYQLTQIGPGVFISGLEVKPGAEPGNYFDAKFRVVSFRGKSELNSGSNDKGTKR